LIATKLEDIIEILIQQPIEVRQKVEEVSVDMWGGFPKVVESLRLAPAFQKAGAKRSEFSRMPLLYLQGKRKKK
jgi:hypothetical protein